MKNLLISCLILTSPIFASDDDHASRDNADAARDAHENGSGRAVDCGTCDWGSRDKDDHLPGNDRGGGTIPNHDDSKD